MNVKPINNPSARPPIVAVMGHIDHGKSTLLDYIRKTNIVENEAGGITQHISAYEVVHVSEKDMEEKITFLDTPGHQAFSKMRERGASVADIIILIVSAEDGVKPQTIEAWKTIEESKTPSVVAINKIDKPGANVDKTKNELAEHGIFLENYGGKIPFALISAKTGEGVSELLSLLSIMAEMENLTGDAGAPAEGFVVEADMDPKRGIRATLIIKNGTLKKGMTVAVGQSISSTRIMENFKGETISEATFSSPIRLVGFDHIPKVGAQFVSFPKKEQALEYAVEFGERAKKPALVPKEENQNKIIPIVLKADTLGSIEAIEKEIGAIKCERVEVRIISSGVGTISENEVKNIARPEDVLVIGFGVKADKSAIETAERRGIKIELFQIIYKLKEWLEERLAELRPKVETMETHGKAKVIKIFNKTKERIVFGGKVTEGVIGLHENVKILRRDFEIGRGKIVNLEKSRAKTSEVESGAEFGAMMESKIEIAPGDTIESFSLVVK